MDVAEDRLHASAMHGVLARILMLVHIKQHGASQAYTLFQKLCLMVVFGSDVSLNRGCCITGHELRGFDRSFGSVLLGSCESRLDDIESSGGDTMGEGYRRWIQYLWRKHPSGDECHGVC